ncbi:accessory Sec system glycosylation chaperone GtfB, partial [Streptococcus pneumoniae]|nr:accessory Sec system glycosylation chaperone GtfB [Streptococcus pneumoniae]
WLDKKGQLRLSERYNKQGRCFAKTAYKSGQEAFNTTYYSTDGQERIVENHATGDIILTLDQEPLRIFKSRVDFIR